MPRLTTKHALSGLALLAGFTFAMETYPRPAQAQTSGMMRREDRRGTRQEARQDKRECNASGESTRAGCRQEKRDTRQEGRSAHLDNGPATYGNPP